MRVRSAVAIIVAFTAISLAFLITLIASPLATPGWAGPLTWSDLGGPYVGPAQALAINPDYPDDQTVFAGGHRAGGYATWIGHGLFHSADGGATWQSRSGPPDGALFDVAISPDWSADHYALAGYFPSLWATHDGGVSWQQIASWPDGGPFGAAAVAIGPTTGVSRTLLVATVYGALSRSTDSGATWTDIANPASIRSIDYHALDLNIALAAGYLGVWRSGDAGLTWSNVLSGTQANDVVYRAGAGEAYTTLDGQLWRSGDGGATWARFSTLEAPNLDRIGVSADGAGLFVAQTNGGIYRYDAAASSFVTLTGMIASLPIQRIAVSPQYANDHTVMVGTPDGVWISHDAGTTFVRSPGFYKAPITRLALAPDYATGGDLFASGEDGIWRRASGVWYPANGNISSGVAIYVSDLAVSPSYPQDQTLFAGMGVGSGIGTTLYKTTDVGAHWRSVLSAETIGRIAISPGFASDHSIYALTGRRIQSSSDGGETWTPQPFWNDVDTARLFTLSPNFVANHTQYAVGSAAYFSNDGGANWHAAAASPPITATSAPPWTPERLAVAADDTLYLSIYRYDDQAPYPRHDQLWTSTDGGNIWSRIATAPDLPVTALAVEVKNGGRTIYMATGDDDANDETPIAPDLYRSVDGGATWENLGAAPSNAPSYALVVPPGVPNTVLAANLGVWSLAPGDAPTVTPNPCQELLKNGSFEEEGIWRIPTTAYPAGRTTDKHYQGSWSMRTGIVAPAADKRSYSDFSQDVTIPNLPLVKLTFQRWSASGAAGVNNAPDAAPSILSATTLDEFYQRLDSVTGDLQYGMVITPTTGAIHFLYYAQPDNQQAWVSQQFDLAAYKGLGVRLQFGTFNDGTGNRAAQYFDVMSLQACSLIPDTPTPTATTTITATPTITPTPPNHHYLPAIRYVKASPMPMGGGN